MPLLVSQAASAIGQRGKISKAARRRQSSRAPLAVSATDHLVAPYNVVENPVHVHDIQATILHCMGIDHKRLTDVHGEVVKQVLA